jgi:hypothetical protein
VADASTANQYDCSTAINTTQAVPAGAAAITGTTVTNGPGDSYGGALVKHTLYYGISDLEPGVFGNAKGNRGAGGGNDDPVNGGAGSPYPYTFLGADATVNQLQAMTHTLVFQQTFGWVANTNLGISDISSADLTAIMSGATTDWSHIPKTAADGAAGPVTATPTKIILCQRDLGSGTRSSADIVFTGDGCNPYGAAISNTYIPLGASNDNFSTPDELACVQANANSIGYVSVDNFSKAGTTYPNVKALTLDGRTASNAATATGSYQYAVEASINKNGAYAPSANETAFFGRMVTDLQALATAPQSAQVNALPGHAGNASNNGTVQVNGKINVTSFARDILTGNSCSMLNLK